jgi:hypothetical protein
VRPLGLYMHYTLLPVGYPPTSSFGGFRHARCFLFGSIFYYYYYYYYYYSEYNLISILIEWLGSHVFQCLVWAAIFKSGFYSVFIILFYLAGLFEISVCPKSFLLWHLVGTEKVRSSPLASGWYRESPFCIIFLFIISRVVISFWRYDN